jgi:hypothetical protein
VASRLTAIHRGISGAMLKAGDAYNLRCYHIRTGLFNIERGTKKKNLSTEHKEVSIAE